MRRMAIVVGIAICAVGCGDKSDGTRSVGPSRTVAAISVGPDANNLLRIGLEQVYAATVRWSDGSTSTEAVIWRSDAPLVATIDNGGRARGIDTGEATLVATYQGIEGILRIRVLPNYDGGWTGAAVVRTCRETGDWLESDVCRDLRAFSQLPSTLALTQDRERLSGVLTLDDIEAAIADGTIRNDGTASLTARLVESDQGMTLTIAFEPVELRVRGDNMSGTLTMTASATGLKGDFKADFEMPQLLRSGVGLQVQSGTQPGGLRALLLRQSPLR
jgi:hypothetical protein